MVLPNRVWMHLLISNFIMENAEEKSIQCCIMFDKQMGVLCHELLSSFHCIGTN